ncbi:Pre-mRNA-splicing factor CWC22 [Liparis tanakae]|uniref:Pre-mRNA-splicing factor CWC22 homolog n=1 Tax=Liparis tanakae TaxID=230148 RepID=A0A4Z2FNZ8_9TELE|nr:Pre-mRNA-splicing factor CWC22 [Liparis tanakae]
MLLVSANHLQSRSSKAKTCFGLVADQKRSQYKERGRSMNSTGSGKSSTVSSVSELLDLYEEDPEEILMNLGFGREEPDLASKIPSRFFSNFSTARGIDIKVYLGAQLQRMEIEVLTTVANEFFNLYSQVSGQSVQCISSKDSAVEAESSPPPRKRRSVPKLLEKMTKHNLFAAASESLEDHAPKPPTQANGHAAAAAAADHTDTNGHTHAAPEQQEGGSTEPDHQAETVNQNHARKKDGGHLATVAEETNGDGEESPEQSRTGPAPGGRRHPESADSPSPDGRTEEGTRVEEEKILTSTPEKAPPALAPLQLAQLRTEKTDSFDMEEVQESSDSCDSETTVTSHPSLDVATPLAMDQPAFELPDGRWEEAEPSVAAEGSSSGGEEAEPSVAAEGSSSGGEEARGGSSQSVDHCGPTGTQQAGPGAGEQLEGGRRTDPEPEASQRAPPVEQEPRSESVSAPNRTASSLEPEDDRNPAETASDENLPSEAAAGDGAREGNPLSSDGSMCPPSPVLSALNRAKQKELTWGEQRVNNKAADAPQTLGGRHRRRGVPLQRSSSLPSAFLSPSAVVSSVRIQFGRGQASCTKPRYSYKYTSEVADKEEEVEEVEEEEEEEGQSKCLSTLIINPAPSSDFISQPPRLPSETPIPPKPIPHYLMRSTCSLQSCSPPPAQPHPWSSQSVPDLSSNRHPAGKFHQTADQNQRPWNPAQTMFPYPNPTAPYANQSPNHSPYPFPLHPAPQYPNQYPYPQYPYAGPPHHLHHHNLLHHSSLASLYQPAAAPAPRHGSLSDLHRPSTSAPPPHFHPGHSHPGTPETHQQAYGHPYGHPSPYPYGHPSPYHGSPHGSQFASPYHAYNMSPHQFPYPVTQCPPMGPGFTPPAPGFFPGHGLGHGLQPGFTPPAPGFFYPGVASTLGPAHGHHPVFTPPAPGFFPGPGPNPGLQPGPAPHAAPGPGLSQSSTEMQLRRALHEIRGTVQNLIQKQADNPDAFSDHRAALLDQQSLAEFYQKRQSLNLFRSQMTELEKSIVRQQSVVYKHLSPADRMELEQLQSLRSAVSDLLREQLLLQSELSYGSRTPSTGPSSRTSTPVPGADGGVYRASININPVPAPRPNTTAEEEEGEESEEGGALEEEGAAGGIEVRDLQQLLREIRESVAQEVRQEIYGELLAAATPPLVAAPTSSLPAVRNHGNTVLSVTLCIQPSNQHCPCEHYASVTLYVRDTGGGGASGGTGSLVAGVMHAGNTGCPCEPSVCVCMDSPGRSQSPSPVQKEPSGPLEDESGPAAEEEEPRRAGSVEGSPKEKSSPGASPAGRSPSGSPASKSPASKSAASKSPASKSAASGSSDDSTSSDDEDEHHGALRKLRSSVAQIKRSRSKSVSRERDGSWGRDRSRSRERDGSRSRSRGRDGSRSRGQDRSRSRERDRGRYDRGRYARDRYDDRHDDWRDDRDGRDRWPNRGGESDNRRRGRSGSPTADREPAEAEAPPVKKKKEEIDPILTRTGGAYIPPAKLRMMQQQITDKTSLAYQRMSWEALKKSINGLINKVNVSNIVHIIQELLQENIVRGRGLLSRSVLQAQAASPTFTHVYSAVVAIINSKFPQIGELILKRLILTFRRSYRRNLKQQCLTASKFVAHLINQNVAHEVLCLEMLTLLLERPTDDSVEVAIAFLKECGLKLTEVSPRGINAIFERLRNVLHESAIDKRVQYMIEVMFAIRKDGFKDHPVILEGLDLVDEGDQFTHMLPLDDEYDTEELLNVFKMDPDFLESEEKYRTIKRGQSAHRHQTGQSAVTCPSL